MPLENGTQNLLSATSYAVAAAAAVEHLGGLSRGKCVFLLSVMVQPLLRLSLEGAPTAGSSASSVSASLWNDKEKIK